MYFTAQQTARDNATSFSQLVRKLWSYRKSESILAATTPHAVAVTITLADELGLQYYRHFCKTLIHPTQGDQPIGSITFGEIILNDNFATIPQGYVEHQVALMKYRLLKENGEPRPEIAGKTVILVRETLDGVDQVTAAVEELRKRDAQTILLATPIVRHAAIQDLQDIADGLTYGTVDQNVSAVGGARRRPKMFYPGRVKSVEKFYLD